MNDIKVGYLTGFIVIKTLPHYDSYLTKLMNSELLALLPKKWAMKEHKINDTGWAVIYEVEGARITLSQKCPQYVRKMLEYLFAEALAELGIKLKRVASSDRTKYTKVAAETNGNAKDNYELFRLIQPYMEKAKIEDYISEKVSFVKYSKDIKEYVINALCPPGMSEEVHIVTINRINEEPMIDVTVNKKYLGLFIGAGGVNILLASKLCGYKISVLGVSEETLKKFKNTKNQEVVL